MKQNPIVSVEWLFENFKNPDLVILDASTKENKSNLVPEFKDIQIKGARIFNMETVFVDEQNNIPNMFPSEEKFTKLAQELSINKNSIIVVYDNLGIYTSPRAWWMFKTMGHKQVFVLNGGLTAWKKAGLPCEPVIQQTFKKGNFIAEYLPELVTNSNSILENIKTNEALVIDARSEDRFYGRVPEPRENMASGHIPNSVSLPYKEVLNEGKMKSTQQLETVFDKINTTNKKLIFTCGSGVTACIILLASELLSTNKKTLYDGSWAEWGQFGKFPVE